MLLIFFVSFLVSILCYFYWLLSINFLLPKYRSFLLLVVITKSFPLLFDTIKSVKNNNYCCCKSCRGGFKGGAGTPLKFWGNRENFNIAIAIFENRVFCMIGYQKLLRIFGALIIVLPTVHLYHNRSKRDN